LEKECESDCTSSFGILYAKIEAKLEQRKKAKLASGKINRSKNVPIQVNGFELIFRRLLQAF